MPRNLSTAMLTALSSGIIRPAFFVAAQFANETLYLWSGIGSKSWNGQTWLGVGTLGTISAIEEGSNIMARGITLSLSGLDSTALAEALQNVRVGLPVTVYFALADGSGAIVSDPVTAWAGRMDQPTIEPGADTATITLNCESRLLNMNVACDRRLTVQDAQRSSPGDIGLAFQPSIQMVTIYWGSSPSGAANL